MAQFERLTLERVHILKIENPSINTIFPVFPTDGFRIIHIMLPDIRLFENEVFVNKFGLWLQRTHVTQLHVYYTNEDHYRNTPDIWNFEKNVIYPILRNWCPIEMEQIRFAFLSTTGRRPAIVQRIHLNLDAYWIDHTLKYKAKWVETFIQELPKDGNVANIVYKYLKELKLASYRENLIAAMQR